MICQNCKIDHIGTYGSGRFCGVKCARGFSTKNKREEINKKVSSKLTGRNLSDEHKKNIEIANNFNRKEKIARLCLGCNTEMLCNPNNKKKFCKSACWTKYTEKNKEPFLLYRQRCNFHFNFNDYTNKFDSTLVEKYGWYSPVNKGNNPNGVSKDHMVSVKTGYDLGIDPNIINHPANCQILLNKQNQSKGKKNSITVEELLERIQNW